jgi:hypothetical protein
MVRGLSLVALNCVVLWQLYKWFYRYVNITGGGFSARLGYGGPNLGVLLGFLLSTLWYVSTNWPDTVDVTNPLGTLPNMAYVSYLITVMPTVFAGSIVFVVMQNAGQITRLLLANFELGFYAAYVVACACCVAWILLIVWGALPRWIGF